MFEQLRQRLSGEPNKASRKEPFILDLLRPEDASELNLSWNSHFNTPALRQHIKDFPGLSLRVRGQTDYIIGDQWRRRSDVGQLTETRTRHYRAELVEALLEQYRNQGYRAIVLGNDEQSSHEKFYLDLGFSELERIVYYEKPDVLVAPLPEPGQVQVVPYHHSEETLTELLEVDHAAFPWLWWNSRAELEYYRVQEGVNIYLGYQVGLNPAGEASRRAVGYFGFTLYERWAHLDRLAVIPELQGQKVGAYLLGYAIRQMGQQGARRVTLSTQLNNSQSQRLYEGFGFQRVKSLEYSLIGKWLKEPERA
ncbi:MAG TPA: GNAT family N-acetyltransferase [Chloroflexia bacterium]|nr:GNAT family N-acetyltransferase [Chloroflexia bacterium]